MSSNLSHSPQVALKLLHDSQVRGAIQWTLSVIDAISWQIGCNNTPHVKVCLTSFLNSKNTDLNKDLGSALYENSNYKCYQPTCFVLQNYHIFLPGEPNTFYVLGHITLGLVSSGADQNKTSLVEQ